MTWRHLHGNLDQRFTQVRGAIQQRRELLVAQAEAELLANQRRRVQQLNNGMRRIADQAHRRAVALLDEHCDLASGGKWGGRRLAMFEAPHLAKPPSILKRRRARVAEIDALTRRALAELAKLYDELLPYPDKAEAFENEDLDAVVDRLMEQRCR